MISTNFLPSHGGAMVPSGSKPFHFNPGLLLFVCFVVPGDNQNFAHILDLVL